MLLTTINRIERYTGLNMDVATDEGQRNLRWAKMWASASSSDIELKLGRYIEKGTHVEYIDVSPGQRIFPLRGHPVSAITSVAHDAYGLFIGGEVAVDSSNFSIGADGESLQLTYDIFPGKKVLKVTYVGGLAAHPAQSTYALTGSSNMTAGKYVSGSKSGAVGSIVDATAAAFVVEVLYGVFQVGDVLTEWDTEFTQGAATGTGTIASITSQGLVEAAPDLVLACECEIRYRIKHMHDFENSGTQREGINRRAGADEYELQPETWSLLRSYARIHL